MPYTNPMDPNTAEELLDILEFSSASEDEDDIEYEPVLIPPPLPEPVSVPVAVLSIDNVPSPSEDVNKDVEEDVALDAGVVEMDVDVDVEARSNLEDSRAACVPGRDQASKGQPAPEKSTNLAPHRRPCSPVEPISPKKRPCMEDTQSRQGSLAVRPQGLSTKSFMQHRRHEPNQGQHPARRLGPNQGQANFENHGQGYYHNQVCRRNPAPYHGQDLGNGHSHGPSRHEENFGNRLPLQPRLPPMWEINLLYESLLVGAALGPQPVPLLPLEIPPVASPINGPESWIPQNNGAYRGRGRGQGQGQGHPPPSLVQRETNRELWLQNEQLKKDLDAAFRRIQDLETELDRA